MNGMLPVFAVLVDDQESDRRDYAQLLGNDDLRMFPVAPSDQVETVDAIEQATRVDHPSVILLDYRLDEDPDVRYRGGSLAAALRDRIPNIPLVLLTTEAKFHDMEFRPGVEDLFDWRLLKGSVSADRSFARLQVIELAIGYQRVAAISREAGASWNDVAAVLDSDASELVDVARRDAFDPTQVGGAQLARWILHVFLRLQGVLIDPSQVRALTGLDTGSFELAQVRELLEPARYSGVFGEMSEHYWTSQVQAILTDLVGPGTVPTSVRAAALSKAVGSALEPSRCTWCAGERVLRACTVCAQMVDAAHALNRKSPPLPEWSAAPIACFRCIAEGRVNESQLVGSAQEIALQITTGEIAQPVA